MPKGPIRRAQLIAPFGVGAMFVVRDGTSVITAGLDHWFESETRDGADKINPQEFFVEEWRLQHLLNVDHFRLPPDYRRKIGIEDTYNCHMTVPFLRFPQWNFCPGCNRLSKLPLTVRSSVKCQNCETRGINRYILQVPFVAMCRHGHLQDFPWREWVHRTASPICKESMKLISTGGTTLAAQKIICECGVERNLARIVEANTDGNDTFLSRELSSDRNLYLCNGKKPWLGTEEEENCNNPLHGSLRSASNVYFAEMQSAIYLPRGNESVPSDLIALFENPPISTFFRLLVQAGAEVTSDMLKEQHFELLQPYNSQQVKSAIEIISSKNEESTADMNQVSFRRSEYDALIKERDENELLIESRDVKLYTNKIPDYFSKIMLVKKLKETRALSGFTRIFDQNDLTLEERKSLLSRGNDKESNTWLPAYIVYGEGIFIEFNESRLNEWQESVSVINRVNSLLNRNHDNHINRRLIERPLIPKFILLHTFAHLLINQLTFDCGYSTAALRERLYVSDDENSPMSGVLIYTAAGDAEGTMGGLVAMGENGNLELVIQKALDAAKWCAADPVCMELGAHGQGPNSCNLAACHNCALVPETACEEFNRFLDRALLIGSFENPNLGYFIL